MADLGNKKKNLALQSLISRAQETNNEQLKTIIKENNPDNSEKLNSLKEEIEIVNQGAIIKEEKKEITEEKQKEIQVETVHQEKQDSQKQKFNILTTKIEEYLSIEDTGINTPVYNELHDYFSELSGYLKIPYKSFINAVLFDWLQKNANVIAEIEKLPKKKKNSLKSKL